MSFEETVNQVISLWRRRGRVTYRVLQLQFELDDNTVEVLRGELIHAAQVAVDEDDSVLVWLGDAWHAPF